MKSSLLLQIPTTVMGAVDASIGIKTAVNFHERKNKLGTYAPPLAVFIDPAFLKTCDRRHLSNGAAEILKMACIKDAALFELLEQHGAEMIESHFQVSNRRLVPWCMLVQRLFMTCGIHDSSSSFQLNRLVQWLSSVASSAEQEMNA